MRVSHTGRNSDRPLALVRGHRPRGFAQQVAVVTAARRA
jgi:hypothetical protein